MYYEKRELTRTLLFSAREYSFVIVLHLFETAWILVVQACVNTSVMIECYPGAIAILAVMRNAICSIVCSATLIVCVNKRDRKEKCAKEWCEMVLIKSFLLCVTKAFP